MCVSTVIWINRNGLFYIPENQSKTEIFIIFRTKNKKMIHNNKCSTERGCRAEVNNSVDEGIDDE